MSAEASSLSIDVSAGLPVEAIEKEKLPTRLRRLAGSAGRRTLNLAGIESLSDDKERVATMGGLGAMALLSTLGEYHLVKHWPDGLGVIRDSGRHPLVGYLSASAASRYKRFNGWVGAIGAGLAGDAVVEVAQATILSGPSHVPDIVSPKELAGNEQDLYMALAGAGLVQAQHTFGALHQKLRRQSN